MGLVGIVTMKTLVLCVDRDNDIGAKTGLQDPLIGRDQNLAAATKLGLADPEDSDVNALLSAVSIYDGLQKDKTDAEVATICGDVRVGAVSDLVLTKQLDQVLEQLRPDRVFLVSDGAEDEAFSPIIGSRIRVDHGRRVYVRQPPTAEPLYYTIGRQLKNPRVRRKIVAPLGFVLLLFGAIYLALPNAASGLALILAGLYFIMISYAVFCLKKKIVISSLVVRSNGTQRFSGNNDYDINTYHLEAATNTLT